MEPNGADGSFSPVDTGNSTGSAKEGYTLNWNSKAARYEQTFGPERGDCTTKDGQVPGGYRSKTTLTLQYEPPTRTRPARFSGERRSENRPSDDAAAKAGCTPFEQVDKVVGAPAGAFDDSGASPTGTYLVSDTVTRIEPTRLGNPGNRGLLPEQTFTATSGTSAAALSPGVLGERVALKRTSAFLGGQVEGVTTSCDAGSTSVPKGAIASESWTGIRTIAVTDEGAPILRGRWTMVSNPNDVGVAGGCVLNLNEGALVMIPKAAIGK
ncbi:MAG: hypothetical protein KDB02_10910 [Acidimicrobiales bacterium]|nr:hypothetical protein [Acidimicrobiales bacterium]